MERHKERPETEARLAAVLASLGQVQKPTVRNEEQELLDYDDGVFEKSKAMVQEMQGEFARLGIPLFCKDVAYDVADEKLKAWRQRVVELLEDLCEE